MPETVWIVAAIMVIAHVVVAGADQLVALHFVSTERSVTIMGTAACAPILSLATVILIGRTKNARRQYVTLNATTVRCLMQIVQPVLLVLGVGPELIVRFGTLRSLRLNCHLLTRLISLT